MSDYPSCSLMHLCDVNKHKHLNTCLSIYGFINIILYVVRNDCLWWQSSTWLGCQIAKGWWMISFIIIKFGLTCLPVLIMFRSCCRHNASLMSKASWSNSSDVKEHNWWPLIPFSAERLTEVRLNSCTVHSVQRYTWSSVHWVGSGGEEDTSRSWQKKGWPSLLPTSSFWSLAVCKKREKTWEI